MHRSIPILFTLLLLSMFNSCLVKEGSNSPSIEFVSFSDSTMVQSSINGDSIYLTIRFEDVDGDIGRTTSQTGTDIIIYDLRTGNVYDNYRLPNLPEQGSKRGVEGTIRLRLFSTCCIFDDNIPPCSVVEDTPENTLSLGIVLIDRADNMSEQITTPPIRLRCE